MLSQMFLAGAKNLEANQEIINELNVFPVPDGDTGTNMTATIMQAANEVYSEPDAPMDVICKSISSGSLRGARGNSGVILSQLLRGFTKVVKKHDEITGPVLAEAFEKAVETAYKAVMKPKEGTILTVAKGAGDRARELAATGETDIEVYFQEIIKAASETLETTPDLLPVLKEAGVVDSGGKGLLEVLKGAYDGYLGKGIPFDQKAGGAAADTAETVESVKLRYAYCVVLRVIINQSLNRKQMIDIKGFLGSVGDDVKINDTGKGVFLHIHTNDPGLVIQKALLYGEISEISVKNIAMEGHVEAPDGTPITAESFELGGVGETASDTAAKVPAEHKDTGFVAVCAGVGMAEIFKSLGCDIVIEGGQTMNPSTDDIIRSAERVNADKVFILPNNKNIILAAEQAKKMTGDDRIIVIPTKTVPQGISAMVNFIPGESAEENENSMRAAISAVSSGEVTYAVRDVVIEGQSIKQGDYMGIGDSGILFVGDNRVDVTVGMLDKLMKSDSELISVYYGEDVDENEAAGLLDRINSRFSGAEVELQYGGQPIYDYIVSVE